MATTTGSRSTIDGVIDRKTGVDRTRTGRPRLFGASACSAMSATKGQPVAIEGLARFPEKLRVLMVAELKRHAGLMLKGDSSGINAGAHISTVASVFKNQTRFWRLASPTP